MLNTKCWGYPLKTIMRLFLLLLFCAEIWSDDFSEWPKMGPLPAVIDLGKGKAPPKRYGVPVQMFTPKQRKTLWNARIRKDHPRIYITKDNIIKLQEKMKTHPAYPKILKRADAGDTLASAFVYQITGNRKYARTALSVFDDLGNKNRKKPNKYYNALIFDWCHNEIDAEANEDIIKHIAYSALPGSQVDPGQNEPAKYRSYHGFTLAVACTPALSLSHSYYALAHYWPGVEVNAMSIFHADGSLGSWEFSRDNYGIDGSVWVVFKRAGLTGGAMLKNKYAFATATGIDVLNEDAWGKNFNNMLYWLIYNSEHVGGNYLEYFYSQEGVNFPEPLRGNSWGLHTLNHVTRNPHYQWFINKVLYPKGPMKSIPTYGGTLFLIELALWWDPTIPERKPLDIPCARFLAPGTSQLATFRSGFKGKGDTIVTFTLSDSWDGDSIGGALFGSFKIYKDEYLSTSTREGPFWHCTYGNNNLVYFDTSTRAKKGYDINVHPKGYISLMNPIDKLKRFPKAICGTVTAFETKKEFDYIAFHNEPTFYPPEVVKEWSTQVVFLRPGVLIRFDRSEVAHKKYQPRFFMWIKGEKPKVNGKVVHSEIFDFVEDYDGDEMLFSGHLHRSKLHMKTLLPHEKVLRLAYGSLVDAKSNTLIPFKKGKTLPPSVKSHMGNTRGGHFDLKMRHKTDRGEQIIPCIRIFSSYQPNSGVFKGQIKGNTLRLIQTAAQIDKKFRFDWYPTIQKLMTHIKVAKFGAIILSNYEHWVEGNIFYRSLLESGQQPPFYTGQGQFSSRQMSNILKSNPARRSDIKNVRAAGHLEIRLPGLDAAPRQYFLNVITITDHQEKDPAIPQSALEEDDKTVTAVLTWKNEITRITYNKHGALNGHIKIERDGKMIVDRDFIQKLDFSNQPFGSDFIKGKRK